MEGPRTAVFSRGPGTERTDRSMPSKHKWWRHWWALIAAGAGLIAPIWAGFASNGNVVVILIWLAIWTGYVIWIAHLDDQSRRS